MKRFLPLLILAAALPWTLQGYMPAFSRGGYFPAEGSPRAVSSLNVGWDFARGDGFKARVNLPHTLNVVGFEASGGTNYQGPAVYEKRFDFAPKGKRQFLHFEAIMGKSAIFLNGEKVGERFGGYHPIHIEVTGRLKAAGNVLRVECDNADDPDYPPGKPQAQLDFAYFGGIYRDVWLIETGPVAVSAPGPQEGVYLATKRLAEGKWQVTARVVLDGQGAVRRVYEGREVPETFEVEKPAEWTPDTPALHFLRVEALAPDGSVSDAVNVRFGFRDARITAKEGLVLNGKPWRKVIGANRHQDFAFVGNAMSNLLHYRDAVKLREAGLTLVRNAHYLQDPAFMDACDEVGLFVIANTPGWQFWNGKPIFGQRVLDDIRALVRRDRSRPCLLLWEPILNETWYPEQAAKQWVEAVKALTPNGPSLCACDSHARGQEAYDVVFGHPIGSISGPNAVEANGRPAFTREWGDCVSDWSSNNSPSRIDRAWGESAQLVQAFHYLDAAAPNTTLAMLLAQPPNHFGGALWHSFDHSRGCHPDTFYGGIMTSARIPKTAYWMFKAMLAKPGPQIPNVDLSPFVHVAHELSPISPREITLFSNVPLADLALNGQPLKEVAPFRYTTQDGKGFSFYQPTSPGTYRQASITGEYGGKPFRKTTAHLRTAIKLQLDTLRTDLVADGSELVVAVATFADRNGTPKHLSSDRIRFTVEGPAEIVDTEDRALNPQQTRYGEAVVLLRLGATPGKVTLRAEVDRPGVRLPKPAALTFETKPSPIPLIR